MNMRWLVVVLHRWMGLIVGLYLGMLGLTGAGLVLAPHLFAWERGVPARPAERADESYVTPDVWLEKATRAYGPLPAMDTFSGPLATPMRIAAPTMQYTTMRNGASVTAVIAVDGYTGEPLAHFIAQEGWAIVPLSLHMGWFLPYTMMWTALTAAGCLLVAFAASGVVAWWPRSGRWRAALSVPTPRSASELRRAHGALGAWVTPVLLAVALSGVLMSDKDLAQHVARTLGSADGPPAVSSAHDCPAPINPGRALEIARQRVPGGELATLHPPADAAASYRVTLRRRGSVTPTRGSAVVTLDACGRVAAERGFDGTRAGDALLDRIVEIHGGMLLGAPGEALILVSGLALAVLPIAGLVSWGWRLRQRALARG